MPDEGVAAGIRGIAVGREAEPGAATSVDGSVVGARTGVPPPLLLRVKRSLRDIPHSLVGSEQLAQPRAAAAFVHPRESARAHPTQLLYEICIPAREFRVRIFCRNWNSARQRCSRETIVVRQLPIYLCLEKVFCILHRQNVAGLVPVDDDAELRIVVTKPSANGERALRASESGDRKLGHKNDS